MLAITLQSANQNKHTEMYWNKQTKNKPGAKKRSSPILIIASAWFLPWIVNNIIEVSKHTCQVLQKKKKNESAHQSNDLLVSGLKSSKIRKTCLRQGDSVHPCFADANPLYLDSHPSVSEVLGVTGAGAEAQCRHQPQLHTVPIRGQPEPHTHHTTTTLTGAEPPVLKESWGDKVKPGTAVLGQGLPFGSPWVLLRHSCSWADRALPVLPL